MPESNCHRQDIRLNLNFQAKLDRGELNLPIEGMTRDLGQMGTLIKTKQSHALQLKDTVCITIFIPPNFCGQEETIALQGKAVVKRIDLPNQYVAVQFRKPLRQFERINTSDILMDTFI